MAKQRNKALEMLQSDLSDTLGAGPLVSSSGEANEEKGLGEKEIASKQTQTVTPEQPKENLPVKETPPVKEPEVKPTPEAIKPAEQPVKKEEVTSKPSGESIPSQVSPKVEQHAQSGSQTESETQGGGEDEDESAEFKGVNEWFKKAQAFYHGGKPITVILDETTTQRLAWAESACGIKDARKSRKLVIAAITEFFWLHHGREIEKINEKQLKDAIKKMKVK